MAEVIRTTIRPDQAEAYKANPAFRSVYHYGTLQPLPGEIGSLTEGDGQDRRPVERIFVEQD